ncbi:uncharacterized protein ARMOST_04297 [Armillaria ostoyae]|uniref:Uncharacterized protein n=1 Tax=Armillaria ostoyae TaxID=47428 RepID=A0A284QWY0_ARMOS|nr:uncharacterized protein ARMOST_04297 [Armillaria ostoyae]
MDQIPTHTISLFVRTEMPMGCQVHRDFLRPYLPKYYRVKYVAKQNPGRFAQFQSRMWTLWIRCWEIQPPDPEDAKAVEDWLKLCQRILCKIIQTMSYWIPFYVADLEKKKC